MESFGFSMLRSWHLQIILLHLFWLRCLLFLFPLIALARNSRGIFNRSRKSRHPLLILSSFQLSIIEYCISCEHIIYGHFMSRYGSSVPTLLRVLIVRGCWILSDAFFVLIEMTIRFLSLILLMWCIILIDLWMLNNLFIPEINTTWLWYMILLVYCWTQFANFLLEVLYLISSRILVWSFLVLSFSHFDIR